MTKIKYETEDGNSKTECPYIKKKISSKIKKFLLKKGISVIIPRVGSEYCGMICEKNKQTDTEEKTVECSDEKRV